MPTYIFLADVEPRGIDDDIKMNIARFHAVGCLELRFFVDSIFHWRDTCQEDTLESERAFVQFASDEWNETVVAVF